MWTRFLVLVRDLFIATQSNGHTTISHSRTKEEPSSSLLGVVLVPVLVLDWSLSSINVTRDGRNV